MLPRKPETLERAKARFPDALETIWDVEAIRFSGAKRPGEDRRCVFDFHDGLRLIVSRERMDDGEIKIHMSASVDLDSGLAKRIRRGKLKQGMFGTLAQERFAAISGFGTVKPAFVQFIGVSDKGVPHWHIKEITDQESLDAIRHWQS